MVGKSTIKLHVNNIYTKILTTFKSTEWMWSFIFDKY